MSNFRSFLIFLFNNFFKLLCSDTLKTRQVVKSEKLHKHGKVNFMQERNSTKTMKQIYELINFCRLQTIGKVLK